MRMSNSEAIMWAVEKDPALRSDFCNLTILDERPSDERLLATAEGALEAIPRLRQRVVAAPLRVLPPDFTDDPTLDVAAHLRVVGVPSPGDERELLDLCGQLAEQPLDRARPLWEYTLVEGLEDGKSAMILKVHHSMTDGVGGMKLLLMLFDFERDPDGEPALDRVDAVPVYTPVDLVWNAVGHNQRRVLGILRDELSMAMALAGCPTIADVTADLVVQPRPA